MTLWRRSWARCGDALSVVAPGRGRARRRALAPPRPVLDLRHVVAVAADVFAMVDELVADFLLGVGGALTKLRHAVNYVADQMETVEVIDHAHVERRGRRSLFLVAAHMNVVVAGPPIGEAMDQPRIAVKGEDDWFVDSEQGVEVAVLQAVRMLAWGLQRHHINDVDDPYFQFGRMLAQELDRGQRLKRRHIAAAGHHDVRLAAAVVARPWPDAESRFAMLDRLIHRQPLRRRLLAGDDDIHV